MALELSQCLDEEKAAFRFGASLLMPAEAMYEALGRRRGGLHLDELRLLKRHFGVSMQALAYRAADLGIIDGVLKRELFIKFSTLGWRKQEPDELPLEEPTLWRQLVARAKAEGVISEHESIRWGVGEDGTDDLTEDTVHGDPRALLTRTKDERARVLKTQAEQARDLYVPGSELMEWPEGFVEDENSESA